MNARNLFRFFHAGLMPCALRTVITQADRKYFSDSPASLLHTGHDRISGFGRPLSAVDRRCSLPDLDTEVNTCGHTEPTTPFG